MRSSFFNSLNGDRKYNATHWAEYFSQFIGNGVYAEPSTSMQVQAVKGMTVKVGAGACFINGYAGYADGSDALTLDLGTSAKRIDRIVIRLDYSLRSIYPAIIKGTAASSPVAPAIVRDGTYYDICIAEITVGINAAEITQSDIKDVRGDNTVCGWVAGTIDQIDTTELFAQYEAQWELLRAACDQDADAVISAWAKLNTVNKVNGVEPVGGNILLALNNIPDGGGYYKSGYYIQAGTVNITSGSATVTFDKAYSEVPVVFTSYTTSTISNANPIVVDRTETGFTVKKGTTEGDAGFDWVAFGKLDETTEEEYDIGSEIAEHLQAADIHVSAFDKNKWNGYSSRIDKNKEEILSSKEDITALQAQDTLINSRLDNITKLPEGSTSGDAELADIRVGYDGTTYPNAGDAVRRQIADVRQDCLNGGYEVAGAASYTFNNAVDYPLLGLNLYGKSTQDGTPTPDAPIDIVSVGDSGSVAISVDNGDSISITANITSALPLCGIPVDNYGNYTDSNGQQWVCDELIYNADGTGKIIKNIRKYTFTGTEEGGIWQLNGSIDSTKNRFQFKITDENIKAVYDTSKFTSATKSRILCDKYKAVTSNDTWTLKNGIAASHTAGYIAIYDENYATIATINDWIAYLAENPVTVIYQLNKPQEIELTAAEMAALRELQTFDGVSNVSNDSGADMDVKVCTNKVLSEYVFPITTGLQAQIDELKVAVLSLGGNV